MICTAHARSSAVKLICIVIQLTCQSAAFYVAEILMKRKRQGENSKIHLACNAGINSLKATCRQLYIIFKSKLSVEKILSFDDGRLVFIFLSFFLSFWFLSLLVCLNNVINENTQTYLKYSSRREQQILKVYFQSD